MILFLLPKNFIQMLPSRMVFNAGGEKGGEASDKGKDKAENPQDKAQAPPDPIRQLDAARSHAVTRLQGVIKDSQACAEATSALDSSLIPLKAQLENLPDEKKADQAAVGFIVETAIKQFEDGLKIQFGVMVIEGKKFHPDHPMTLKEYASLQEKAKSSLETMKAYNSDLGARGGKVDEKSLQYQPDGTIQCRVNFTKTAPGQEVGESEYAIVHVNGANVDEGIHNKDTEDALKTSGNFYEALKKWKETIPPPESFIYKNARGSDVHFNASEIFATQHLEYAKDPEKFEAFRQNLPLDLITVYDDNLHNLANKTWETHYYSYGKKANGDLFIQHQESTHQNILDTRKPPRSEAIDLDQEGKITKKISSRTEIIGQVAKNITTITEYWPAKPGEEPKMKSEETKSDTFTTSKSSYDADGNFLKRENYVEGCEDMVAIDTPATSPAKMVAARDDLGRPIFTNKQGQKLYQEDAPGGAGRFSDEKGRRYLQVTDPGGETYLQCQDDSTITIKMGDIQADEKPQVQRVMTIIQDGKEVKVMSLKAMNEERATKGMKQLSHDEYIHFLAGLDDKALHFFYKSMHRYRADYHRGKINEHYQTSQETVARLDEETGCVLGDCEDLGFLSKDIAEEKQKILKAEGKIPAGQEKISYVVTQVTGAHAFLLTIGKNDKGKYTFETTDTIFGLRRNGHALGESGKDEGYDTLEAALQAAGKQWNVQNTFLKDLGDGSLLQGSPKEGYKIRVISTKIDEGGSAFDSTGTPIPAYENKDMVVSKIDGKLSGKES